MVQFGAAPVARFRQAQGAGVDSGLILKQGWHVAGGGEDNHVGGEGRQVRGVLGQPVQRIAQGGVADPFVRLALDVPSLTHGAGVFVRHDVAAIVARAAVPLHCVEFARALGEPVDQALELIGRETCVGV
jgi:hypothetical protein